MPSRKATAQSGFSLLEVMIVVLIIGIAAATVRLTMFRDDPLEAIEKSAHAFAFWFSRQVDQTLLSGNEKGLYFTEQSVAVLEWREGIPEEGEPEVVWEVQDEVAYSDDDALDVELMLDNEARQWVALSTEMPEDFTMTPLHLILLPSEEYQPSFTLQFTHTDNRTEQISITGDGYNRLKVSRNER